MATKTKAVKCSCGFVQKHGPETTSGKCLDCDRTSPSTGNNLKGLRPPKGKPFSDTGLYWSEQGEIACKEHGPFFGSDTWVWGRWMPLTKADLTNLQFSPKCETCKKGPAA